MIEHETHKLRIMLILIVLFLGSFFFSCREMEYMVWGETANAAIVSVRNTTVSRGRSRSPKEVLAVKFTFTQENGVVRKAVLNKSPQWRPERDNIIPIEYIPDKSGFVRPAGTRYYFSIIIFLGMTGVLTFYTIKIMREAYDY